MKIKSFDHLTDRQIDALIASQIFKQPISIVLLDRELDPILADDQPVPCYSREITAAWQLVNKIVDGGYSIVIDFLASENCWRCLVHDENFKTYRAFETTPERAICKALLLREGILK